MVQELFSVLSENTGNAVFHQIVPPFSGTMSEMQFFDNWVINLEIQYQRCLLQKYLVKFWWLSKLIKNAKSDGRNFDSSINQLKLSNNLLNRSFFMHLATNLLAVEVCVATVAFQQLLSMSIIPKNGGKIFSHHKVRTKSAIIQLLNCSKVVFEPMLKCISIWKKIFSIN